MSFSYDTGDLEAPLNRIRFLIQDTTNTGHFFEDEELEFAIAQEANIYRVAANLCRAAAAKLAKTPSQVESTVEFDADKSRKTYLDLAAAYDKKADDFDDSTSSPVGEGMSLPSLSSRTRAFTRNLHFT